MWGEVVQFEGRRGRSARNGQSLFRRLIFAISGVVALSSLGCTKEGICDANELQTALLGAFRGDTVEVGVCRVTGTFTVPEGVRLAGQGPDHTILAHDGDLPVVELTTGAQAPVLSQLAIESRTPAAVVARGSGQARIDNVDVRAFRGIGIGAEGLSSLELDEVSLVGPVTANNAMDVPLDPSPEVLATHGMVLLNIDLAELEGVSIVGFAEMGTLLLDGRTEWRGGSSSYNVGTGLFVHDGSALLEDLELCGGFRSLDLHPPYAGVFTAGAEIVSRRLDVCDCQGFGLVHDSCDTTHEDLSATENQDAALWVQNTEGRLFELLGSDSTLEGNGRAGLVLSETGDSRIEGATFANSSEVEVVREIDGIQHQFDMADGIQIVQPLGQTILRDLRFDFNERTGLLIDRTPELSLTLERVETDGEGRQFGAILQEDEVIIRDGWDVGVTRFGATVENDANLEDGLDVDESIAAAELPDVAEIIAGGLEVLLSD